VRKYIIYRSLLSHRDVGLRQSYVGAAERCSVVLLNKKYIDDWVLLCYGCTFRFREGQPLLSVSEL
jgi:hypothetical protein